MNILIRFYVYLQIKSHIICNFLPYSLIFTEPIPFYISFK